MTDFTKPRPTKPDDHVLEVHGMRHVLKTEYVKPQKPETPEPTEEAKDGQEPA